MNIYEQVEKNIDELVEKNVYWSACASAKEMKREISKLNLYKTEPVAKNIASGSTVFIYLKATLRKWYSPFAHTSILWSPGIV